MEQKTIRKEVQAEKIINASKEAIFKIISDHEGTSNWIQDVKQITLIKPGENKIGLGAIRKVNFKPKFWSTIDEEIIEYKEQESYSYTIIKGMPGLISHKGSWLLKEEANGMTKVIWNVQFEFKKFHWFALLVNNFAKTFNQIQVNALDSLDAYLKD
jgi:ribosome-associated toxin RatA of RatAB toxin-antitoxin module